MPAKTKKLKLIPPDKKRCQCITRRGSFMSFGTPTEERCTAKPTVIVTETKPRGDGLCGSMSLCDEHLGSLTRLWPAGSFTTKAITPPKTKKAPALRCPRCGRTAKCSCTGQR